jgi:acetyltransferase-like isoleucine patch superfamily enzyme
MTALSSPNRQPIKIKLRRIAVAGAMVLLRITGSFPVHSVRVGALKLLGARIDSTAVLYHGSSVRAPHRLSIGAHTNIGDQAILDARGGLFIGANVNFSTAVHVWTAQHGWDDPDFKYESAPVRIEDNAWVSTRVTILPGVTVGEGAVIAAGAVVTKDVAPYSLVGGVPAKYLADRTKDLSYTLPHRREKLWWW